MVPLAIIGAIGALETARTSDAQRETLFNISTPAIMYFVFAACVAVILSAFIRRLRIWRLGQPANVLQDVGGRVTNLLTMGRQPAA